MMEKSRLYIITRKDLHPVARAVQSGHAVAEWILKNGMGWRNNYLIYLQVADLVELKELSEKLEDVVLWHEPDLDNELTAIAVLNEKRFVRKLEKLAF